MTYYHWAMMILGGLSIIGSFVLFAIKVLRYLWRIELAVESLVEQNKIITEENKSRDSKIKNLERYAVLNEMNYDGDGITSLVKKKYNI